MKRSVTPQRMILAVMGLVVLITAGLSYYVPRTLESIARNLPVTLLEQERNAETLIREVGDVAWAIELWGARPSEENRERVAGHIREAQVYAMRLRANYNLDNMIGAAGINAVAHPALSDLQRWFDEGVAGRPPSAPEVNQLMQARAREAERKLSDLLQESRAEARALLLTQEQRLDGLAVAAAALTAFAVLMVTGLVLLLALQRRTLAQRAAAEAQAVAARRSAEEANRAKSDFLANMSHELRTPLNAILGFSAMIKDEMLGPVQPVRYREYAGDIHGSGEHLLSIISDILDLSKVEAGKYVVADEEFEAVELMQAAARLMRDKAEREGLKLDLRPPAGAVMLHADRRALLQVLLNLLSNALKFTESGSIVLRGEMLPDGSFALSVRDTGIGMTPDQIAIALEPFGQVQNALTRGQSGTGLGLPLVDRLITLHGGRLSIESQPGRGTLAMVTLPAGRVRA